MMTNPMIALIEQRISANRFDTAHTLSEMEIEELSRLATRAPSAYNLQNWRFVAVRTPQAKALLRELAFGQVKVEQAAVTFIICGVLPDHATLATRLGPFVEAGFMSAEVAAGWQEGARTQYADPQSARDEAVRSASLGAATLIYAAEALGLVSSPMVSFDADAVTREFKLASNEIPVMFVALGRSAPGNWPQKPRRPIAEILEIA